MRGIVTDEKGAYVKAAIVTLFKEAESAGETEEEAVTYDETDEKGRFLIQDLNPDDKYIIEVYVRRPEPAEKPVEPEPAEKPAVPEPAEKAETLPNENTEEPEPAAIAYETEAAAAMTGKERNDGSNLQGSYDAADDPGFEEEPDGFSDENDKTQNTSVIDSLATGKYAGDTLSISISTRNMYDISDLKEKAYMRRTNLW